MSKTEIQQPEVISGVLAELLDNMYINNVIVRQTRATEQQCYFETKKA